MASMRRMLGRAQKALAGRSFDSESGDPRDRVSGKTIWSLLNGIFAWSIDRDSEGRSIVSTTRNRPVEDLAPDLALRTARKALAVLRLLGLVAADEGRLGQSPSLDLWVCWSELSQWVEELERSPAPVRRRSARVPQEVGHGAGDSRSRCRSGIVEGAGPASSTVPERHRPLCDGSDGSETGSRTSSLSGDSERSQGGQAREEEERPAADPEQVGAMIERGVPVAFIRRQGERREARDESQRANPQRSTLNSQPSETLDRLRSDLRRLGVKLVDELLADALQLQSPERVAEVLAFAISREIPTGDKPLRPWGPGAVFLRLTRRDLVDLPADDGWPKSDPVWKAEWDKQAAKRAREKDLAISRKAAAARSKSIQALEAEFGHLVDQVPPRQLVAALEIGWRSEIRSVEDLRQPMIRRELLLAAALGKFNTSEGE